MSERLTEGVLLEVDKTATPGVTYVTIAEITAIDGPSESRASLDRTKLATIGRKRFRPGRTDGGSVDLDLTFEPSDVNHLWLHDQIDVKVNRSWRITVPKEDEADKDFYIKFDGFLTDFNYSSAGDDEFVTSKATIKIDGDVVYEFASSGT